jgi:hypothetical protein
VLNVVENHGFCMVLLFFNVCQVLYVFVSVCKLLSVVVDCCQCLSVFGSCLFVFSGFVTCVFLSVFVIVYQCVLNVELFSFVFGINSGVMCCLA